MAGTYHSWRTSASLDVQHRVRGDEPSQAVKAWRRKVQLPASGHPDSQGQLCHPRVSAREGFAVLMGLTHWSPGHGHAGVTPVTQDVSAIYKLSKLTPNKLLTNPGCP